MKTHCTADRLNYKPLGTRRVTAHFDGGDITSDAGALLLRELEEKYGIIARVSRWFDDWRDPGRIEHGVEELLRQRVFGLVLGYGDLNDHDELGLDPVLAAAAGKVDPKGQERKRRGDRGAALAGKSTLNRLELGCVN